MNISEMAQDAYRIARHHGFWLGNQDNLYAKIALAHTELSEAVECLRDQHHGVDEVWYREEDGKPEGFVMELADAVIRIGDMAERAGVDLERGINEKMAFNRGRPFKHAKNA